MVGKRIVRFRTILAFFVVIVLAVSVLLSFQSFTGYIINDEVNIVSNSFAVVLFLVGLLGAYFLLKKR